MCVCGCTRVCVSVCEYVCVCICVCVCMCVCDSTYIHIVMVPQESSSVLDEFIKELTSLLYPKGRHSGSLSHPVNSSLIPSLEVNQFYENAITTQEFAVKLEKRINEAIKQSIKKIDIEEIQMICWK